ncbi:hypothetical protein Plhal304r1_c004g0018141 [Plasmopara halstedii]
MDVDDAVPAPPVVTPAAPAPVTAPARPPRLLDDIRNVASLRRDNVAVNLAQLRVETPKPLASDIEAIEALYDNGKPWLSIAPSITSARPYQLPRARYSLVLETRGSFARIAPQKILQSFVRDHNNPVLAELFRDNLVVQLSKLPDGNLCLKVRTREACMKLERQAIQLLGGSFNIDSDLDTDCMMKRLFELGCRPLYDTFRRVNVATGITTATWRVYFVSTSCPFPLIQNSTVCDQVMFGGRLFPTHGKNTPYPSERLPFDYRSAYAIDLTDHPLLRESPVQPPQDLSRSRSSQPTSQAIRHLDSSLKRAIVTRTTATPAPSSTALVVLPLSPSVDLSISSPSSRLLTPPPSPPRRLGPVADTTSIVRRRKNKRSRSADGFYHLTTKERPKDITGVTTSNYFSVLEQIETEYELVESHLGPDLGPS